MVLKSSQRAKSIPVESAVAAFSSAVLLVAGVVHLWFLGFGPVSRLFGALCCGGAILTSWLGWRSYRLDESIVSMAAQLEDPQAAVKADGPAILKSLAQAIIARLDSYAQNDSDRGEELQELRIQLQLANRQKQNTEAIIYSIRDAVIVADDAGRVLMANEAAGKIFGFDGKNCHLQKLDELISEDKNDFVEFTNQALGDKNRAARRELEFIEVEEDRAHTFDCIVSCVKDQRDKTCGVVAVLHDITREKEVSQMKNDFVSHVSHELKTPLASITAYSEMLVDGEAEDEETRKDFYSVIQSQADRLTRLIEDILNTARIESGLIKIDKQPVSLTILIEEQLGMIKGFAEEKNIAVTGQEPIVFDQVNIDKDMMSQVIVNLLSNAVKYTPAGGSVKIETEVDDIAGLARVKVTDTGVGIPEDDLDHVFDKFYRVGANKKQAKGTGLGLNLVKQIVEKVHEGRVFVSSDVNVGSTFGFELPLACSEAVAASS